MSHVTARPRYNIEQSWQWNCDHAPPPVVEPVRPVPGSWEFCGLPVCSPLGIAAGPLLNGRWCLYYASLGFDVLTYKTVRSRPRACYDLPNLQPVDLPGPMRGGERNVPASPAMQGSWAVSFGMPSHAPDVWRADVERTRRELPAGKLLSVSVVGSVQPGWTIDELADDYARCARWAVESGADTVETNFSCPNVSTCDGQLYQQPGDAAVVAQRVREAIGRVPYVIKIGHLTEEADAMALVDAVSPHADALAMTNSVGATVVDEHGRPMFAGQQRGICGDGIRAASLTQVRLLRRVIAERGAKLQLIGVGGISTVDHVREYLHAGAHAVHLASAVMVDPSVGLKIREEW